MYITIKHRDAIVTIATLIILKDVRSSLFFPTSEFIQCLPVNVVLMFSRTSNSVMPALTKSGTQIPLANTTIPATDTITVFGEHFQLVTGKYTVINLSTPSSNTSKNEVEQQTLLEYNITLQASSYVNVYGYKISVVTLNRIKHVKKSIKEIVVNSSFVVDVLVCDFLL
ncbi:hypothetical protein DPMN_157943 [Dreissena polymorpha]|uniref:Uncharacterized protein n=1 Tax=Dreissena polymorpha TaxID=45954 RepID=A0A9D4EIX0_DREPO|nr:hypothetical protein DPMN_157943 [Dreissena polymorpha]